MPSLPSYDQALATILSAVTSVCPETVPVRQSLGRVLAADLEVPRPMPDLPRSAVDGFAFHGEGDGPRRVIAEVRAGFLPESRLATDEAMAIMTGAVVPEGADRIAMVEHCRLEQGAVHVPAGTRSGDFINPAGSEAQAGEAFAHAGRRIGPGLYPALFCAGLTEVPVHRPVRLGLLVSGDEVREVEDGPAPGMVFNTNRYVLEAVCRTLGVEIVRVASVDDDESDTRRLLDEMRKGCDVVLTSGGVSKGTHDHLGAILRGDSYDLLVPGTRVKPGRPLHVARPRSGGGLIMAMPGYPAALLTNTFLYLVPTLKKMAGHRHFKTHWLPVTLADAQRGRPGKMYLNRVALEPQNDRWLARDPGSQMSSHFLVFARCDGLLRMPTDAPAGTDGAFTLPAGAEAQALHFGLELS